ncbi:MAG: type II toxin-antitoxin system HicB family antitoxin [Oscillospiraceae bacterium]
MKLVYPVVFTKLEDGGYMAYVPDLQINTQGEDLPEAISMARDAIGLVGIDMEDDGKPFPAPSNNVEHPADAIVSLVDVDLLAYRRANERKTVRRNVTLPSWLNAAANEAGLNVSAILQAALKQRLDISI